MERKEIRWFKITFLLVSLAALLAFLASIGSLVRLIVISALLAYIIDPIACFLESRGLSRFSATCVIFPAFALITGTFVFFFLPPLAKEVRALQAGFDYSRAAAIISDMENIFEKNLAFLGIKDLNLAEKIQKALGDFGAWVFSHLLDIASLVTDLVIVPFMVFFLLKDGRVIKKWLIGAVPNRFFEFSANLLHKMDLQLGNYFRGQFMDAIIVGILSVFALWLLKVKYFLIIGSFAGMANLIPYLGPAVGAFAAMLVSFLETGDFTVVAYIALAFIAVKLADDVLIQPLIVARSVKMHPLLVLLSVIIGGKFFGILGMLLSVPAAGFIIIALKESIVIFRRYYYVS